MKTLVVWDVDGTLTDSRQVIMDAYRCAASENGFPVPSYDVLKGYMCGGLKPHMDMLFGPMGDLTYRLMASFTRYREDHASEERLFPGVREVLERLGRAGVTQAVATMKLESSARDQLVNLGVDGFFVRVAGDSIEGERSKADMIRICESTGSYDRVLMVGDCPGDRRAAEEAGAEFVAASFGYGYPPDVCARERVTFVTTPFELLKVVGI